MSGGYIGMYGTTPWNVLEDISERREDTLEYREDINMSGQYVFGRLLLLAANIIECQCKMPDVEDLRCHAALVAASPNP